MRTTWILSSCLTVLLLLGALAAQTEGGWFDGGSSTEGTNPRPGTNLGRPAAKKEPSGWEKLGSGTKKFFTGIGDTLSPSKKPTTTQTAINPYASAMKGPPKPEKKSWFSQMFGPKEPDRPRNPSEWMSQTKRPEW